MTTSDKDLPERVMTVQDEAAAKARRKYKRDLRHAHAQGLMQGLCSLLGPGDIVLDCGANIGEVTARFAETGAHVHAFEPDPWTFSQLSERTGHLPNVTLHNAAVGAHAGRIRLMRAANFNDDPFSASVKSSIITGGRSMDDSQGVEVELISLPDFLGTLTAAQGDVAVLKLDIEGAELELLETMLERDLFSKIRLTLAETHERKFKELRPRFHALREAVSEKYPQTRVNLDWI